MFQKRKKVESAAVTDTVIIGVSDGENVQILSGLNPGETYYYAYFDTYVKTNNKQATVSFNLLGTGKNRSR